MDNFLRVPINLGELFKENYATLCSIAKKWTLDKQVAEDLVMAIFDKAIIKIEKGEFKDPNHVKAFLITSIKNACIDYLRTERKRNVRLQNLGMTTEQEQQHDQELSEVETAEGIRNKKLLDEINRLPDRMKEIIKLHYYEDKSLDEIGLLLGIAIRTVRNIRDIAVNRLREIFSDKNLFN